MRVRACLAVAIGVVVAAVLAVIGYAVLSMPGPNGPSPTPVYQDWSADIWLFGSLLLVMAATFVAALAWRLLDVPGRHN